FEPEVRLSDPARKATAKSRMYLRRIDFDQKLFLYKLYINKLYSQTAGYARK
ncbi:MAG: hypothetical protein K0S39_2453, partial [Paenibacillus sp.]|nr:hypothetical protein [Paenibacillus sp.]